MSRQINLFNPIFLKQKKYFSAWTMAQALVAILIGCVALGAYAAYQATNLQRQADETSRQLADVQAQLTALDAVGVPKKTQSIEDDVALVEKEVAAMQKASDILHSGDIGNGTGYAEYLRAFSRQIFEGIWLTGFRIYGAGNEIEIRGRALRPEMVPIYIGKLRQEPAFRGKSFSTLEMKLPKPKVTFGSTGEKIETVPAYVEFVLQTSDTMPKHVEKAQQP